MTDNRLADYLDHMRQAAADACGFVQGMDKAAFLQDKRTQQAVVMSLIVLGEAATKVMERHEMFAEAHIASGRQPATLRKPPPVVPRRHAQVALEGHAHALLVAEAAQACDLVDVAG